MKTTKRILSMAATVLLLAGMAACSKEATTPTTQHTDPTSPYAEKIVGRWNLEMVDDYVPNFLSVTTTVWDFTPEGEWAQTIVYDDGVHYDSIVNSAVYLFVSEDSVQLVYEGSDGTGGFVVLQCDNNTLCTRGWYAQNQSYYTYTFSRM